MRPGIDDREQGLAAGVLQTSMQVGPALILAVTTAMITSGSPATTSVEALDAFRPGLVLAAVIATVGALVPILALVLVRDRVPEPEPLADAAPEPELEAA